VPPRYVATELDTPAGKIDHEAHAELSHRGSKAGRGARDQDALPAGSFNGDVSNVDSAPQERDEVRRALEESGEAGVWRSEITISQPCACCVSASTSSTRPVGLIATSAKSVRAATARSP
jgi:hypothetical protein